MDKQPLIDQLLCGSPPNLDFSRREGCRSPDQIEAQIAGENVRIAIDSSHLEMIRCLMLLWNDHFELAHNLAQEMHHSTGSLMHGILHRREGDFWNAKYWLSRVGVHPADRRILEKVQQIEELGTLRCRIIPKGNTLEWNHCRFVDVCSGVLAGGGPEQEKAILKLVQGAELKALMGLLLEGNSTGK